VFGTLLESAQKIAERLDATLVNMRFVKPLDENLVIAVAARHRAIITIEENATIGGAGSAVGRAARLRRVAHTSFAARYSGSVYRARLAR
jgi:1-deoxy-D-xylulose-5-phosphate synthase